jgi:hypothetical protein
LTLKSLSLLHLATPFAAGHHAAMVALDVMSTGDQRATSWAGHASVHAGLGQPTLGAQSAFRPRACHGPPAPKAMVCGPKSARAAGFHFSKFFYPFEFLENSLNSQKFIEICRKLVKMKGFFMNPLE